MVYSALSSFCVRTYSVVSRLVFVVDPVERFVRAVLDAVLGDPLVRVAATLRQDARHHAHFLQVDLQPLVQVVVLGQPRTPKAHTGMRGCSFVFWLADDQFGVYPTKNPLWFMKSSKLWNTQIDRRCQCVAHWEPIARRIPLGGCWGVIPEALVVESGLVGDPGSVPAAVLVLMGAADLVRRHRAGLEAQRSVVRTLCVDETSTKTLDFFSSVNKMWFYFYNSAILIFFFLLLFFLRRCKPPEVVLIFKWCMMSHWFNIQHTFWE